MALPFLDVRFDGNSISYNPHPLVHDALGGRLVQSLGYEACTWNGIVVPARTPEAIVAKLNRDIVRTLELPEVREHTGGVS